MSNVIIGNSNTTLLIAQYYFHQILYKLLLVLNRQLGFSFKSVKPNFTSPTLISSLFTILACGYNVHCTSIFSIHSSLSTIYILYNLSIPWKLSPYCIALISAVELRLHLKPMSINILFFRLRVFHNTMAYSLSPTLFDLLICTFFLTLMLILTSRGSSVWILEEWLRTNCYQWSSLSSWFRHIWRPSHFSFLI